MKSRLTADAFSALLGKLVKPNEGMDMATGRFMLFVDKALTSVQFCLNIR